MIGGQRNALDCAFAMFGRGQRLGSGSGVQFGQKRPRWLPSDLTVEVYATWG